MILLRCVPWIAGGEILPPGMANCIEVAEDESDFYALLCHSFPHIFAAGILASIRLTDLQAFDWSQEITRVGWAMPGLLRRSPASRLPLFYQDVKPRHASHVGCIYTRFAHAMAEPVFSEIIKPMLALPSVATVPHGFRGLDIVVLRSD